jgi:hypothetical protein
MSVPLSAKFASLRCHIATIPDLNHRAHAYKLLAEIEERTRPLGVRLEQDDQQQERTA